MNVPASKSHLHCVSSFSPPPPPPPPPSSSTSSS